MTLWEEIIENINSYVGLDITQENLKNLEQDIDGIIDKYELDKDFKLFVKIGDTGNLQITPRIGITEKILDTDILELKRKK